MPDRSIEWKVGITVLGAIFVFIMGSIFLSESFRSGDEMVLLIEFERSGGIQAGDAVRVSGVKKGRVVEIELGDRRVQLKIQLDGDTILYSDARFVIEAFGLMGEMMVAVDPGSGGERLDISRVLPGTFSAGLGDTFSEAGPLLEDVRRVIAQIEGLIDDERMVKPLEETVGNLRGVSDELESILGDSKDDIRGSFASGRASAEKVDHLIARNEQSIDSSVASLRSASRNLEELIVKLKASAVSVESLLAGFDAGEGSLGKLAKDDAMHDEVLSTLDNMNRLINDIRENPGRYVKIEIF